MAEMAPASPSVIFQDIFRWDDHTAFEVFVVDGTATAEDAGATGVVATLSTLDALVPVPSPADVVLTACDRVEVAAALGRPPVIVTGQTMTEKSRISGRKVSV